MDRINETGIIGSLRWWYEVIVRGLGSRVCSAIGTDKCNYDSRKSAIPEQQLCNVCYVFGATGWRRRFRVEVAEDQTQPAWEPADKMLNIRPPGRTRGWYLPPGRVGAFTLVLHGEQEAISLLAALLLFLEKWGNLGPKPQLGYGVFAITNREAVKACAQKWRWKKMDEGSTNNDVPDFRRFGFARYRFQPTSATWWTRVPGMERVASQVQLLVVRHKSAPVAPVLKNEWRFNRWQGRREDEIEIFGALRPKRIRSKVTVSWAYPQNGGWEVRSWAWLPHLPKKQHIAGQVWDIVRDEPTWQKVIGMPGNIFAEPEGQWQEREVNECIRFLQEAQHD